jgi:hypothetical protein
MSEFWRDGVIHLWMQWSTWGLPVFGRKYWSQCIFPSTWTRRKTCNIRVWLKAIFGSNWELISNHTCSLVSDVGTTLPPAQQNWADHSVWVQNWTWEEDEIWDEALRIEMAELCTATQVARYRLRTGKQGWLQICTVLTRNFPWLLNKKRWNTEYNKWSGRNGGRYYARKEGLMAATASSCQDEDRLAEMCWLVNTVKLLVRIKYP